MNIKSIFLVLVPAFLLTSCHKEIKSEKGGIDLISNVYFEYHYLKNFGFLPFDLIQDHNIMAVTSNLNL